MENRSRELADPASYSIFICKCTLNRLLWVIDLLKHLPCPPVASLGLHGTEQMHLNGETSTCAYRSKGPTHETSLKVFILSSNTFLRRMRRRLFQGHNYSASACGNRRPRFSGRAGKPQLRTSHRQSRHALFKRAGDGAQSGGRLFCQCASVH